MEHLIVEIMRTRFARWMVAIGCIVVFFSANLVGASLALWLLNLLK